MPGLVACALFAVLIFVPTTPSRALNTSGWQWFKTDVHVHSVVSGDGLPDIGIISQAARAKGYNAMFITDHQAGSNFPISTVVANHVQFDDSFGTKWKQDTYGSLSATTSALVTSPVKSGTSSLHLKASSSTFGETLVAIKRGPNLRSGDLIFKVSIYPTTMSAGSGLYVSVALGGDASVQAPQGYTTQGGVISPGKSTILVWQCGSARSPSTDPSARVLVSTLPSCTLNTWNNYVINITQGTVTRNGGASSNVVGVKDIPSGDMPLDYNSTTWIKMSAAASNGGTAEGYFDALNLDASNPVPSGDEFAFRNSAIAAFDTGTYKDFPSIEMGYNRHAQRFNFAITSGQEYRDFFQCSDTLMTKCTIDQGIEGIVPTQQTGYPAQLNHPNLPGGVKLSEIQADSYQAFGADQMEVRPDSGGVPPTTMVDIWDTMLQGGLVLVGTWSSDMHSVYTLDDPVRGVATYLFAPSLDFKALMRSLFEGRAYLGRNTFSGRVIFNLSSPSQDPYPARYPVYVSDAATTANVHLNITNGIAGGSTVRWLVNGSEIANEGASSSYNTVKSISLAGSRTYVRAELHNGSPPLNYIAMTEPIFFMDVTGMPSAMSFHIDGIDTPNGEKYTKLFTKGITSTNYASNILSLTLTNPVNSLTEFEVATAGQNPTQVKVNGALVATAASQSAFDSATDSSWFYDSTAGVLHVKAKQVIGDTPVVVNLGPASADTAPPTKPTDITATAISSTRVDLSWTASTDNSGTIDHYNIYRGVGAATPTFLQTVAAAPTSFSDLTAAASTTYTYCIVAFDPAGNSSEPPPGTACAPPVTTPAGGGGTTLTFTPVADAYVRSDQTTTNFGTSTSLRIDGSPIIRSYLRFNVTVSGTITQALLKLTATSSGSGYAVHGGVIDNAWGETAITYGNAPAFMSLAGDPAAGSFVSGAVTSVDVTPLVFGPSLGVVTLVVDTTSTAAMAFSSREAATTSARPQLVVMTSGSGSDTQAPSVPTGVSASPVSSTQINVSWSASTDNSGTVSGYHIYDFGTLVGTVTSETSFQQTGLAPNSSHAYTVDAFDPSGNTSAQSSPAVSASTPPDTQPPSKPGNVQASAPDSAHVNLSWTAATDDVGVTGYDIYRDSTLLKTLSDGTATSYGDGTVSASTSYTYCIVAFDAAGNHSETPPGTACVSVVTPAASGGGMTLAFTPVADTYVRSDLPSSTFGSSTSLRVDTSPTIRSYLRFDVSGLSGKVTAVTLSLFANSSLSTGYDVAPVSDNTWDEATLTYPGPSFGGVIGTSTPAFAGSWTNVAMATSVVPGNGLLSFALLGRSTTALNLASREDATHRPQLLVTTG